MRLRDLRPLQLALALTCAVAGGCICLDLTQARRYRCASDTECAGGWRCGTDGFCVEPSADALRPNASAPAAQVSRVTPVDPVGLPDLIASSQGGVNVRGACADAGGRPDWTAAPVVAQVRGDTVSVLVAWGSGRESLPDGGLPTGPECVSGAATRIYQDRFQGSLGGRRALDMVVSGGATHVLTEAGGVCTFRFAPGAAALSADCRNGVLSFWPTQLRSNPSDDDRLLAFSSSRYAFYDLNDGGVSPFGQVVTSGGRPQVISDMLFQGYQGEGLLTAATDAGFFVSSLVGQRFENDGGAPPSFGFWEPASTEDITCQRDPYPSSYGAPLAMRLGYDNFSNYGEPLLAVHVRSLSGYSGGQFVPVDHALIYRATDDAGTWDGRCVPLPAPSWNSYRPIFYGPRVVDCRPCDYDHALRDFRLGSEYPDEEPFIPKVVLEARCAPRDGGTREVVTLITDVNESCYDYTPPIPDIARYARPTRWGRSDSYGGAIANDLGHLYATRYSSGLAQPALVLDQAPSTLVRSASGLIGTTDTQYLGDQFSQSRQRLIEPGTFWEGAGGFGGTGNDFLPFGAGVQGQPSWAVVGNESQSLYFVVENITRRVGTAEFPLRLMARFTDAVRFAPPFQGAALRNSAGQVVLLVSSGDALTSADVTSLADNPDAGGFDEPSYFAAPVLDLSAVPLPRTPITSLVGLPPDPDAGTPLFAEAYLVQGGRVFQVTAPNARLWRVAELDLGGAEVLAVTADGRRGRAGTRDGRVYALPSRVLLSNPLEGAPVLDYAQAGATTFAVAEGGLFRLAADGVSPLGTWQPVAVAPMPPDERGFHGARLFSVADQLLLFLHSGWGYKIAGGR